MSDDGDRPGGNNACDSAPPPVRNVTLPPGSVSLDGYHAAAVERALGYFRSERFVVFGYCPGGGEVIWKDGHSSGFGTGGWRMFLEEIAPLGQRYEIDLGSAERAGTHVLLIDRAQDVVYAAPRESAEAFLATVNGLPSPTRRCLCAPLDCRSCPVRTCPRAGSFLSFDGNLHQLNPVPASGAASMRSVDEFEEASMESFPASDAPGYGTAHA